MNLSSDDEKGDNSDSQSKKSEKVSKRLFKPTGPDGKGWGDTRTVTTTEEIILEELAQLQLQEETRVKQL